MMRICEVDGVKALFHKWSERAFTIGDSIMKGGPSAGQISYPIGIVEYENGSIDTVDPKQIVFKDDLVSEKWKSLSDAMEEEKAILERCGK